MTSCNFDSIQAIIFNYVPRMLKLKWCRL